MRGSLCLPVLMLALTACTSSPDEAWFPLQSGAWWQYDILVRTMDGERRSKQILHSLPVSQTSQGPVYRRLTGSGQEVHYRVDETGVQRLAEKPDGSVSAHTVLAYPLQVGQQWQGRLVTGVLEKTGPPQDTLFRIREPVEMTYRLEATDATVRIGANTYSKCLYVRGSGRINADVGNYIGRVSIEVSSEDWYAPGIGLIRSRHQEKTNNETISGGEYTLELEHFEAGD